MQSILNKNKLIIAAAGSGKTTFLVEEALKEKDGKVLITTYTQANETVIKKKIIEKNKCIPENVTVQTWFSFLLEHGVRPFQGVLFEKKIKGLILVNSQSGIKFYRNPCKDCKQSGILNPHCYKCKKPIYFGEKNEFERHYFTKGLKIFSDKLSKFVFRCNEKSNGNVIDRISRIYSHIFIDEVQDLAGYDLELLKLFFNCDSQILLVGDPRQVTYLTHNSRKHSQYSYGRITDFIKEKCDENICEIDDISRNTNFRSNQIICDLANRLFPDFQETTSGNKDTVEHSGVFFIKKEEIDDYLLKYHPLQLRNDKKTKVKENYGVMNFGESKGLSFDRVLIYPTKHILEWMKDNSKELAEISRSKFYVALTRARHSVAIVCDKTLDIPEIENYSP